MIYKFDEYNPAQLVENHLNMGGTNPDNEKIDITNLYLRRNGKPFLPVMGEYHFSRDKRDNWYTELCKMKAGGITIVSTYLMWIYHEEEEGVFDFSGDNDIAYFLECAKRADLYAFIRIGPWAHGECRNGGFPDWLLKKGIKLRTNDPEYMKYARRFYEKIFEQVKDYQYENAGNIIGIQFENELTNDAEHLLALKEMALDIGYKAPLYTVTGWNSIYGAKIPVDDVLPVFAAYVEAPWAETTKELPLSWHFVFNTTRNDAAVGMDLIEKADDDGWRLPYEKYPFATCELGAGLHPTHHRRIIVKGMDAYALSLVKLGSGNNLVGYYMYHGGNNKIGKLSTFNETRSTGYPNNYAIIDYDFHTAISSYGETREQYDLLNMLHMFVQDFGEELATMEYTAGITGDDGEQGERKPENLKDLRYCMRRNADGGFIFVNNYQRNAKMADIKGVVFEVDDIQYPSIDVNSGVNFILPFNLKMGKTTLKLSTAQLLAKAKDTYFFAEIPGIKAQYQFSDGTVFAADEKNRIIETDDIKIVTLSYEQAKKTRKLSGHIYIGENCDIYEADSEIKAVQAGKANYLRWDANENKFVGYQISSEPDDAECVLTDCAEAFEIKYSEELQYGYPDSPVMPPRKIKWKKISVFGNKGFIEINEPCDVEQIYADGKLIADRMYIREPWRVPVKLLKDKECYLVMSEQRNDVFYD